jgi:hypothetical protein
MKITKKHANAKHFNDIEKGTVFKFQTGDHIFMKTERIETGDFECNVVDLINGSLEMAYETAIVIPLEHELIIS